MSGLKLVIPTSFTDLTLPILRDDPMLSAGSLALYEVGHPMSSISGVPANLALIPNVASKEAKALMPAATDASLSALFRQNILDPTKSKVERTSKGAIHTIVPKATPILGGGAFAGIYGQTDLAQYILSNLQHTYYISYWGKETRSPAIGPGALTGLSFSNSPNATNLMWTMSHDGSMYPNTARKLASVRELNGSTTYTSPMADSLNASAMGNGGVATTYPSIIPAGLRFTMAVSGTDGVIDKSASAVGNYFKLYSEGIAGEIFSHTTLGPSSGIHYRSYIEDLTVSGRTYAQVDAIDKAEYTKHILTAGGRYYGDTYTDPAAVSA